MTDRYQYYVVHDDPQVADIANDNTPPWSEITHITKTEWEAMASDPVKEPSSIVCLKPDGGQELLEADTRRTQLRFEPGQP